MRRARPLAMVDLMSVDMEKLASGFDECQYRRMANVTTAQLPVLQDAVSACCPPLSQQPLTAEEAERTAAMFKALGDPVRLRLFSAVASHEGGEACVCDISDVGVGQPTVSHHLKKLREAGLLTSERRGTWVYYRVAPSVLAALSGVLAPAN
jgi:ArsR family transcriptional regulator